MCSGRVDAGDLWAMVAELADKAVDLVEDGRGGVMSGFRTVTSPGVFKYR